MKIIIICISIIISLSGCNEKDKTVENSKSKSNIITQQNKSKIKKVNYINILNDIYIKELINIIHNQPMMPNTNIFALADSIILGKTTIEELISQGAIKKDDYDYQYKGMRIITGGIINNIRINRYNWPNSLQLTGYNKSMSYNEWFNFLKLKDFIVRIKEKPFCKTSHKDKNLNGLNGVIIADKYNLRIFLTFGYGGEQRCSVEDKSTLYELTAKYREHSNEQNNYLQEIIYHDSNLSDAEKIDDAVKLKLDSLKPNKPIKIQLQKSEYIKKNKLEKDEFETTQMYQKRKTEENSRIKKLNTKIDNEFILQNELYNQNYKIYTDIYRKKINLINNNMNVLMKELYSQAKRDVFKSIYGKVTVNGSPKYNADKQILEITLSSKKYQDTLIIPIKLELAKKIKNLFNHQNFSPDFQYSIKDSSIKITSIKQLETYKQYIKKSDIEIKNAFNNIVSWHDAHHFQDNYPNSEYEQQVKKKEEKLWKELKQKEEIEEAKKKAQKERQKWAKYTDPKHIGDKICLDGTVSMFISITIKAYVENVRNSQIQIRIADTEGQSPRVNGETLYNGKIIWDSSNNWYKCN